MSIPSVDPSSGEKQTNKDDNIYQKMTNWNIYCGLNDSIESMLKFFKGVMKKNDLVLKYYTLKYLVMMVRVVMS